MKLATQAFAESLIRDDRRVDEWRTEYGGWGLPRKALLENGENILPCLMSEIAAEGDVTPRFIPTPLAPILPGVQNSPAGAQSHLRIIYHVRQDWKGALSRCTSQRLGTIVG